MLKLPNSIEPAVMAENIVHLRDAESSLDGRVSDLEVTAPKDYSTAETATGQKWIDGKEIYRIVLSGSVETFSSGATVTIGDFDIDTLVDVHGEFDFINYKRTAPYLVSTGNYMNISYSDAAKIYLYSAIEFPNGFSYKIAVYYTKPDPTPGRAPEDEPEKVKEPEPEEKKTTKKKTTK